MQIIYPSLDCNIWNKIGFYYSKWLDYFSYFFSLYLMLLEFASSEVLKWNQYLSLQTVESYVLLTYM